MQFPHEVVLTLYSMQESLERNLARFCRVSHCSLSAEESKQHPHHASHRRLLDGVHFRSRHPCDGDEWTEFVSFLSTDGEHGTFKMEGCSFSMNDECQLQFTAVSASRGTLLSFFYISLEKCEVESPAGAEEDMQILQTSAM